MQNSSVLLTAGRADDARADDHDIIVFGGGGGQRPPHPVRRGWVGDAAVAGGRAAQRQHGCRDTGPSMTSPLCNLLVPLAQCDTRSDRKVDRTARSGRSDGEPRAAAVGRGRGSRRHRAGRRRGRGGRRRLPPREPGALRCARPEPPHLGPRAAQQHELAAAGAVGGRDHRPGGGRACPV